MKRTITPTTLVIVSTMVFALGIVPRAQAGEHEGCSEASLKGTFAYTSIGFIVAAPLPPIVGPYAEVGTQYFDGKGNVTFTYNASQNGSVGPGTAIGKFKVKGDCTGTFTEASDGFTSHFSFVIDKTGNELQAICQDTGAVVTRIGRKQLP